MKSDEAKPANDQEPSKSETEATPFGNVLVGTLIGISLALVGVLTFWSLTQWVPGEDKIASSTYFRNGLLGVAAFIGLGLATWRSMQTERQIKHTQIQLDYTAEQFKLSREQLAVAQVNEQRNTLREAAQMLSNDSDLIKAAGVDLLRNIRDDTLKRSADDVLSDLCQQQKVLDGEKASARALIRWIEDQEAPLQDLHIREATFAPRSRSIRNSTFEGVVFENFEDAHRGKVWTGTFVRCALIDCSIDADGYRLRNSLIENLVVMSVFANWVIDLENGIAVIGHQRSAVDFNSPNIRPDQTIVIFNSAEPSLYHAIKERHGEHVRVYRHDSIRLGGRLDYGAKRARYTVAVGGVQRPTASQ